MKTFKQLKWRSTAKKIAMMALSTTLFVGCGSDKDNTVQNQGPSGTSTVVNNSVGANIVQNQSWNTLKSQYQCATSRMNDLNFTLAGQANSYSIGGQLNDGYTHGNISSQYIGVNYGTKDLLLIQKVDNGGAVSYNVTLSFCVYGSQQQYYYPNQPQQAATEFIGPNAGMSNFQLNYASLGNNTYCGFNSVLDAYVTFYSQGYNGNIPTRFAQAQCF